MSSESERAYAKRVAALEKKLLDGMKDLNLSQLNDLAGDYSKSADASLKVIEDAILYRVDSDDRDKLASSLTKAYVSIDVLKMYIKHVQGRIPHPLSDYRDSNGRRYTAATVVDMRMRYNKLVKRENYAQKTMKLRDITIDPKAVVDIRPHSPLF